VFSEYALKRASLATGIKRAKGAFTKLDPALKDEAAIFEEATKDLATAADRILRKHGKNIIGKQFATKRLADIMIDLFVMACVLSRVNSSVKDKGAKAAEKELEIARVFSGMARRRVKGHLAKIDDNDDELIKSLADHAFEVEGFAWDSL
jgi:acyl-CoA dehydrogenase family member 9